MNDIIKQEIAKTALKKLFTCKTFYISDVTNICKMLDVPFGGELYRMMMPLHCIEYADMNTEVKEWLFTSTLALVTSRGFDLAAIEQVRVLPEFVTAGFTAKPSFFKRITN